MHVGQVSSFKAWEGKGAEMADKVTTSQHCLFLLIPFSFLYAKPPEVSCTPG